MDNIDDLQFKFQEHLKVLNRSQETIVSYLRNVRAFLKTIQIQDIKQVTKTQIEDYIAGLYDYKTIKNKPYKIGTICVKVRAIKRFFEFLEKSNIIFINPSEYIREPKKEKSLPKNILTTEEVNKILDQPNLGTLKGIRDRAFLEVLYSTGIRSNELCNLTIYNADLVGKTLQINNGKGKKDRVVPLGRHAVKFLREYIAKGRPHFTKKNRGNRHLFVDVYGKPLSKPAVYTSIKTYSKTAKIKKKVSPHTFRHTFTTLLAKNGAAIEAIQKMLGHMYLRTTQNYIKILKLDIKKAHIKTHPREKDKAEQSIKPAIKRRTTRE